MPSSVGDADDIIPRLDDGKRTGEIGGDAAVR